MDIKKVIEKIKNDKSNLEGRLFVINGPEMTKMIVSIYDVKDKNSMKGLSEAYKTWLLKHYELKKKVYRQKFVREEVYNEAIGTVDWFCQIADSYRSILNFDKAFRYVFENFDDPPGLIRRFYRESVNISDREMDMIQNIPPKIGPDIFPNLN